jgi:hypothetical protein
MVCAREFCYTHLPWKLQIVQVQGRNRGEYTGRSKSHCADNRIRHNTAHTDCMKCVSLCSLLEVNASCSFACTNTLNSVAEHLNKVLLCD